MTVRKYLKLTSLAIQSEWFVSDSNNTHLEFTNASGDRIIVLRDEASMIFREVEVRITMSVDELTAERDALRGELHESDGNTGS